MSEHGSGIGDDIENIVTQAKAKTEQAIGAVIGDEDLEIGGRAEHRHAAIEDFREDLEVDQAHRVARHRDS